MLSEVKYLTETEKAALVEIKRRVSAIFPVKQYILFGSKARGDAAPDSDVDLLIITARPLSYGESHKIVHEVFEVNLAFGTNFSFVDVDTETWNSELWKYVPLHIHVSAEGISL